MRGRSKMKQMRLGQTIVAEREQAETESERMMARRKVRRKHTVSVILVLLVVTVVGLVIFLGAKEISKRDEVTPGEDRAENQQILAEIVDEDNKGQISTRVRTYIAELEQDFRDLGYRVARVTLPTGTSRELYVDLDGQTTYFKINMDRGSAVSAEDAERMIRYLRERDLHPEYVDVRVEGKAYYK